MNKGNIAFWVACISLICSDTAICAQSAGKSAEAVRSRSESVKSETQRLAESVACIGYMAPHAVLVFASKPTEAVYVKQGDTINGITINSLNNSAVRAQSGNHHFAISDTSKPFPLPTGALEGYLLNLCRKIDKLHPGTTDRQRITIGPGGMPVSDPTSVQYLVRAQPFGALPHGINAITFDIEYGPGKDTTAQIVKVDLTKPIER